jgi:hypothetical protein
MGGQKIHFFSFSIVLGYYHMYMESRGHAYIMIEEVDSYHSMCNKAGFTLWLCKLFRTKVSNNSKLSNSASALP